MLAEGKELASKLIVKIVSGDGNGRVVINVFAPSSIRIPVDELLEQEGVLVITIRRSSDGQSSIDISKSGYPEAIGRRGAIFLVVGLDKLVYQVIGKGMGPLSAENITTKKPDLGCDTSDGLTTRALILRVGLLHGNAGSGGE